jgi:8-oxo-dGTP pyrophosphatase MutT (NUDIX family)
LRGGASTDAEVLMGHRRTRDAWSNLYVFPGGRVDRADHRVPAATELRPEVLARLGQGATPARARALAIAAIRETFEETGVRIAAAHPGSAAPAQAPWPDFAGEDNLWAPALDRLHFLCRAITPPRRPKRFNARFFLADADSVEHPPVSNGELGDLRWFPIATTAELPLPKITELVLEVLRDRIATGSLATPGCTPLFKTQGSRHSRLAE